MNSTNIQYEFNCINGTIRNFIITNFPLTLKGELKIGL